MFKITFTYKNKQSKRLLSHKYLDYNKILKMIGIGFAFLYKSYYCLLFGRKIFMSVNFLSLNK